MSMATSINQRIVERTSTLSRRKATGRVRTIAFYLSLLLAGIMSVLFLPELLLNMITGWTTEGAALGIHRLHVMGIAGVVTAFLLGLLAQVYQPRKRVAVMWGAFAIILSVTIGTLVYGVGRPEEVIPFLAVTAIALGTHPAGWGLVRRTKQLNAVLLTLVVIAVVPVVLYIVTQLSLTTSTADPHATMGHYVMMIGLVIAPLAYGFVAAIGLTGRRLAVWLAALPMAYFGALSVAFPLQTGSVGVVWGIAAIGWAVVFVGVAEYMRRSK